MRALLSESLALFQTLKNDEGIAWSLCGLAHLSLGLADFEHASSFSQEALGLFRTLGLDEGRGFSSIYNKLAVTSRTAATRYAIAHQLI